MPLFKFQKFDWFSSNVVKLLQITKRYPTDLHHTGWLRRRIFMILQELQRILKGFKRFSKKFEEIGQKIWWSKIEDWQTILLIFYEEWDEKLIKIFWKLSENGLENELENGPKRSKMNGEIDSKWTEKLVENVPKNGLKTDWKSEPKTSQKMDLKMSRKRI